MDADCSEWWRGGVIYQIYPRSFQDGNGDGVGDLRGIANRLDYVADLGVDAIWLSPFFRSPMKDFGYDVSDYRAVDPLFGDLADFDAMVARAHELDLKVIIDQVLSHTSDQHPWFQESRRDRGNPKADWYVWADSRPDGCPPNNWLSRFGGSAWMWDSQRHQYYFHNFLESQPDLNFHNPAVQDQLLSDVAFWLERGVDGFRLDTVNLYFHDADLRDNPARILDHVPDNPYEMQQHTYDKSRPENLDFLRRLRALTDEYPGATLVGELSEEQRGLDLMAQYTSGGDKIHMAYSFDLLDERSGAAYIREVKRTVESKIGDGWPCWSLSNHDVARFPSRWGGASPSQPWVKVMLATLLTLRGSVCLYQGDELGLPEADVPYEQLQDPLGLTFWPELKGRDGARTPMTWTSDARQLGFSTVEPWLPVSDAHRALAVDTQTGVEGSVLEACKTFLRWRRAQPALIRGTITLLEAPDNTLVFRRDNGDQSVLALLNLSDSPVTFDVTGLAEAESIPGHGFDAGQRIGNNATLPAYGAFFGRIDSPASAPT